jgi:hypothetical protein
MMSTPAPDEPQAGPLAPCKTSFWAFLEYPLFWVPVVVLTFLGAIALLVVAVTR